MNPIFWSVFLFLLIILGVVFFLGYGGQMFRQTNTASWEELARKHNLTFYPGVFLEKGAQVRGQYRGYDLQLADVNLGLEIVLSASPPYQAAKHDKLGDQPINPEEISELLTWPQLSSTLRGYVRAEAYGQKFYYHSMATVDSPADNIQDLEYIFNLLCDLADAYRKVFALGGEAVPVLQAHAAKFKTLSRIAEQLLRDISTDTTHRLKLNAPYLLCPRCLTCCGVHRTNQLLIANHANITYYGCRICHQSKSFIKCPRGILAVLDSGWSGTQIHQKGVLYLNWFQHRRVFDFDRVAIIQATDEDVERFAVQVGNDTDPMRQPRYKRIQCVIGPECRLSKNTVRILQHTFGRVVKEQQALN